MFLDKKCCFGLLLLLAVVSLSSEIKTIVAGQGLSRGATLASSIPDKGKAESRADSTSASAAMNLAAEKNAKLKAQLNWVFGGKTQHGWQLYLPLIGHLIGTESDADSSAFALALSRWQQSSGLAPTGILDQST